MEMGSEYTYLRTSRYVYLDTSDWSIWTRSGTSQITYSGYLHIVVHRWTILDSICTYILWAYSTYWHTMDRVSGHWYRGSPDMVYLETSDVLKYVYLDISGTSQITYSGYLVYHGTQIVPFGVIPGQHM